MAFFTALSSDSPMSVYMSSSTSSGSANCSSVFVALLSNCATMAGSEQRGRSLSSAASLAFARFRSAERTLEGIVIAFPSPSTSFSPRFCM